MYRCALAATAALCLAASASAESPRSFPHGALRGTMVFADYPQVALNGKRAQLSPGSRVRDQDNRIVMAASLSGGRYLVHYTVGIGGEQVRDVWILRPEEAAIEPWPKTLEQAQTWIFDPTTQRWIKP